MKKIISLAIFVFLFQAISAQEYYKTSNSNSKSEVKIGDMSKGDLSTYFSFSYNLAKPFSNDSNPFITSDSDYGLVLDIQYPLNDKFSIGAAISFNSFSEFHQDVNLEQDNGFIYGNQYRYISVLNFLPKFRYYPINTKYVKPYVGIGAGLSYLMYRNEMSYYAAIEKFPEFAVQPELGALVRLTKSIYFNLNINYNQVWPNSKQPDFRTASMSFGLVFM